jgi:hypothetical protein
MRILLLAAALSACAPGFSEEAATTFASAYSCPLDRETVVHVQPPAEIAADPDRAKVWNEHHHIYTVTGCGATQRFECYVAGGDATNPRVDCNPG